MQPEHLAHLEEVAKPSLVDPDPFEWTPQERADFQYEMVDGIVRVYRGDDRDEEAFPVPGNSYDFFSDMHWCDSRLSGNFLEISKQRVTRAKFLGAPSPTCTGRVPLLVGTISQPVLGGICGS